MADFDLIQTDAQVQSILNDGQSAMGASAQTTLTTEYVMLKDTNGVYHKILKSSFTEAIRDTLAGLIVNNDKGTTINQIAAIASGDFGSITPANLASVLGAPLPKGILTVSANTIFENSAYCLYGNENLDVPTDYGVLITLRTTNSYTGYWGLQFIFNVGVATALYYRIGSATKQEWGSWKSIIMP